MSSSVYCQNLATIGPRASEVDHESVLFLWIAYLHTFKRLGQLEMHHGQKESWWRQCEALGNVELGSLGACHPCGRYDLQRCRTRSPVMATTFSNGCGLLQQDYAPSLPFFRCAPMTMVLTSSPNSCKLGCAWPTSVAQVVVWSQASAYMLKCPRARHWK